MHIAVLIPAYGGSVKTKTMISVWDVQATIGKKCRVSLHTNDCSDIVTARNELVARALSHPTLTHALFVDNDMSFKWETVQKQIDLKAPIVGCVYPKRIPGGFVVWRDDLTTLNVINNSHAKVGGVGMGLTLIARAVFEKLAPTVQQRDFEGKPVKGFFDPIIRDDGPMSEDLSFCKRWRDAGGDVVALLNEDIGHVGEFTYRGNYLDFIKSLQATGPSVGAVIGLCFGFVTTRIFGTAKLGDWLIYEGLGGEPVNALVWAAMGA